jgi:hypothetical protein
MKKNKKRPDAAGAFSATRSTRPGDLNNPEPATVAIKVTNPSDAREALENNDLTAVGCYLRDDVAPLLRLIADSRHRPKQEVRMPPGYDLDDEFEYDTEDMRWAIENGQSELVDGFIRQVAPLQVGLGDMIDTNGRSEHYLKPSRRRRGKPRTKEQEEFEGRVRQDLRFALIRAGGKLEAAVAEVSLKHRISRATVFRIWTLCGSPKHRRAYRPVTKA